MLSYQQSMFSNFLAAVANGNLETIKKDLMKDPTLLIQVNKYEGDYHSALSFAVKHQQLSVIEFLLTQQAPLECKQALGDSDLYRRMDYWDPKIKMGYTSIIALAMHYKVSDDVFLLLLKHAANPSPRVSNNLGEILREAEWNRRYFDETYFHYLHFIAYETITKKTNTFLIDEELIKEISDSKNIIRYLKTKNNFEIITTLKALFEYFDAYYERSGQTTASLFQLEDRILKICREENIGITPTQRKLVDMIKANIDVETISDYMKIEAINVNESFLSEFTDSVTPLEYACYERRLDVVSLLLAKGANFTPNAERALFCLPLHDKDLSPVLFATSLDKINDFENARDRIAKYKNPIYLQIMLFEAIKRNKLDLAFFATEDILISMVVNIDNVIKDKFFNDEQIANINSAVYSIVAKGKLVPELAFITLEKIYKHSSQKLPDYTASVLQSLAKKTESNEQNKIIMEMREEIKSLRKEQEEMKAEIRRLKTQNTNPIPQRTYKPGMY